MYRFDYENEKDMELEAIGVGQIKKWYNIVFWSLIAFAVVIELLLLILFIIFLNGLRANDDPNVNANNITLLIKMIIYAIATPFVTWISWICFKPLVGLVYDVKIMKYKYFADQKVQKQQDEKYSNISDRKDLDGYSQEEIMREADNFGKRIQMPKREPVNEKPNQKYELTVDEIAEIIEKHSKNNK